jgi:hypothetical protein
MNRSDTGPVVYFLAEAGSNRIKIGFAGRNWRHRLYASQVGNSRPLECIGTVPGAMVDEKALQAQLAHRRIDGEWFDLTRDEVRRLVAGARVSWPRLEERREFTAPPPEKGTPCAPYESADVSAKIIAQLEELIRKDVA